MNSNEENGRAIGGIDLLEAVAGAFRRFSQGVKAAIECAIMAADAGAVPVDEDIIAVAGTGKGADSAIVIRAANQNRFFKTKDPFLQLFISHYAIVPTFHHSMPIA